MKRCLRQAEALSQAIQAEIKEAEAQLQSEVDSWQQLAPFNQEQVMKQAWAVLDTDRPPRINFEEQSGLSGASQVDHLVEWIVTGQLQAWDELQLAHRSLEIQIKKQMVHSNLVPFCFCPFLFGLVSRPGEILFQTVRLAGNFFQRGQVKVQRLSEQTNKI